MIDVQVTEEQLNSILQALYLLEDQEWYKGDLKELIEKLNELIPE